MDSLYRVNTAFSHGQHALFRLGLCFILGVIVAGFLTWFMYVLIQFSEQKVDAESRVYILDFVRLKRDESSAPKEQRAARPQQADAPPAPPAPPVQNNTDANANANAIQVSNIPADSGMDLNMNSFSMAASEGEFMPIVRVTPLYPASASSRGIEGTCAVEFTVTTTGSTKDIRVLEDRCTYSGFGKPSAAAAARFKYKPRVINGEAVEVYKVVTVFVFQLENEKSTQK